MTRAHLIPTAPNRTTHPKPARLRPRPGMLLAALGAAAVAGCTSPALVERMVGHIDFSDIEGVEPRIPETATASVPFEVTVWTWGGGCYEIGETEVDVDGRTAVVTPYDYLETTAKSCTDDIRYFEHKATVTFMDPGTAQVVLRYSTDSRDRNGDGRAYYTVSVSPAG